MKNKTTKTLNPLHFEDLDPHRFEDLVRQMIYDLREWRVLEPTGRLGADDGYDARGFEVVDHTEESEEEEEVDSLAKEEKERLWQIQCKRERTITPASIKKYIDEMIPVRADIPHGVIFAAACDFSKKTRDSFIEKMKEKGIQEYYLWGKADLEDMLMQPKNDNLLYAYFGISLVIRKRTVKTEIKSTLAIKRKVVKHLGSVNNIHYTEVLLRDAFDTNYPYSKKIKDFKEKGYWKKYYFVGHYHGGIKFLVKKYYARVVYDWGPMTLKEWDFTKEVNLAKTHDDAWEKRDPKDDSYYRGYQFWEKIPKDEQAYLQVELFIPYERILEIDPFGDEYAQCPHVFVETINGDFFEKWHSVKLTGVNNWGHSHWLSDKDDKVKKKYFPDRFPDVEEKTDPVTSFSTKPKEEAAKKEEAEFE